MIEITKDILKEIYPPRPPESHKYDFGQLIVVGGSQFYSGAPAFNALAAFRAGVDMVRLVAPERAANIIASFAPDLAAFPLDGDYLEKKHISTILSFVESARAIRPNKVAFLVGAGMGRTENVQEALLELLSHVDVPTVLDADAIHAVGKNRSVVEGKNWIFTPHDYEFFVLTSMESKGVKDGKRAELVKEAAQRIGGIILLKGVQDYISDGNEIAVNRTGNAYMTKGGTGDVLAGICGGLLAQGVSPFEAAQAAAYINGRAGDLVAEKLKQGLLASDLLEAIPLVFQEA